MQNVFGSGLFDLTIALFILLVKWNTALKTLFEEKSISVYLNQNFFFKKKTSVTTYLHSAC